MEKYCVIVDAYSTGQHLAPSIALRGYQCIHIQSKNTIESVRTATFRENDFVHSIKNNNNLDSLVKELSTHEILCVIAGCESGVELASSLGERLGIATNGTRMNDARRSKYAMHEALRIANVPCVSHIKTNSIDSLLDWINNVSQYPVVLKPDKSSGSDAVVFCNSEAEVDIGFSKIVDRKNIYGQVNDSVLAQSFLHGDEYIVNTVSADGVHFIAEIWRSYRKPLGIDGTIPFMQELLPPRGEIQRELSEYTIRVLDALEIRHGAAHCEIVYTGNGPILLEVGARAHGLLTPDSVTKATGTNHIELTIDVYLSPAKIKGRAQNYYERKLRMYHVFLSSGKQGILKSTPGIDEIKKLTSCIYVNISQPIGSFIPRSIDTCSTCGIVDLIHEDSEVLENDYQLLRGIELNRLFEIADEDDTHEQ